MLVIPAIDLKNGRCVRLTEGREESAKIYDRDPVEVARGYEREGARLIHIVDLDGAFMGKASGNQKIIQRINGAISIPVEVGGGIRSLADIEVLLGDVGARQVIIGTLAIEDPAALKQAVKSFGSSVIVGIDARGREVALRGWTKAAEVDALALARQVASAGVERIIYTDITRDGRLAGPNFDLTREIARVSGVRVTASGGIASLADIKRLGELEVDGVDSVIVGKALYEGRFSLRDAIASATGE